MATLPRPSDFKVLAATEESLIRKADDSFVAAHKSEDCKLCNSGPQIPFSMAFQPIVDVRAGTVVAYEALVRGVNGEPASSILDHTLHNNRYSIDQRCREKAIAMSDALGILSTDCSLNINFYPNAVYEPKQCLMRTLNAANAVAFPLDRIIFEVTEVEEVRDKSHLRNIMTEYKGHGLKVAIDDFGAGHSGLSLLSEFQPDIIKIDRALVEKIHQRATSRSIVRAMVQVCQDLGIEMIAEGIEEAEEMSVLCDLGVFTMQGYFFAKPAFESLPCWPDRQHPGLLAPRFHGVAQSG